MTVRVMILASDAGYPEGPVMRTNIISSWPRSKNGYDEKSA